MSGIGNRLPAHVALALARLRQEFDGWLIHRSNSGRWLAIRGNTCIRGWTPTELRRHLRRHLTETAEQIGGETP